MSLLEKVFAIAKSKAVADYYSVSPSLFLLSIPQPPCTLSYPTFIHLTCPLKAPPINTSLFDGISIITSSISS